MIEFEDGKGDILSMWAYYADSHKGVCLKYDFSLLLEFETVTKAVAWSHEQEWRIIFATDEDYFPMPCLSGVYLGARIDDSNLEEIISAIKKNGSPIKLYRTHLLNDSYILTFEEIKTE